MISRHLPAIQRSDFTTFRLFNCFRSIHYLLYQFLGFGIKYVAQDVQKTITHHVG